MGLFSRSWGSHFLWLAGYPDRARRTAADTQKLARELGHPLTHSVVLAYVTMLHQFRRDRRAVAELAETTISLCTEHGFPYYLAWAEVLRGWSLAAAGAYGQGISDIRRGVEALQGKAGARLSYYRSLLAEACLWNGDIDDALQAIADGFEDIRKTQECWWEAELHRLRGEVLQSDALGRRSEAESCFRKAIEVARLQHAKSLELRAAVSLGRLWHQENRYEDTRCMLAQTYECFDEGLDTPDLRDAERLLQQLTAHGSNKGVLIN
jgi:adenylate cyclase